MSDNSCSTFFATVPNQVASNQVLTVEFLQVLQESNISMYQEFTEGQSFSHIANKADIVTCNMEYFRHNILPRMAKTLPLSCIKSHSFCVVYSTLTNSHSLQ